jgi:hypothetical protein
MESIQKINVRTETDVIQARMRVREAARQQGLELSDQARISLATSSLAHVMGLGGWVGGEITIESLTNGSRKGVRVVCSRKTEMQSSAAAGSHSSVAWMVDEYRVEKLPDEELRVTMVKWIN